MQYKMKLHEKPFSEIVNGSKEIEFRLYDNKRKKLKIGDTIQFSKLPDLLETVDVEVIDLYHYPTFRDLLLFLGYQDKKLNQKLQRLYHFYSKEQEILNGVLGIKIKVMSINSTWNEK